MNSVFLKAEVTKEVSIYPNPRSGVVTVDIANGEILRELIIQDIQGKNIFQSNEIIDNRLNLNLNSSPGLYIVRMKFGTGKSVIRKLVIQ